MSVIATAQDTALVLGAVAAVIVALGGLLAQVLSVYVQLRNQKAIRTVDEKMDHQTSVLGDVHEQVTTINGKTMAVIADEGETRRIEHIPEGDRTSAEREHIDAVPPEAAP